MTRTDTHSRCSRRVGASADPRVTIRAARTDDLAAPVEIERAAGEAFRSLGMDVVADDDPRTVSEQSASTHGHALA